jgi:hypothetical protein
VRRSDALIIDSCDSVDSLTVYVVLGGDVRDIGVYCGRKIHDSFMSSDNLIEVSFVSRPSSSTSIHQSTQSVAPRGFRAVYSFTTSKQASELATQISSSRISLDCNFAWRRYRRLFLGNRIIEEMRTRMFSRTCHVCITVCVFDDFQELGSNSLMSMLHVGITSEICVAIKFSLLRDA